MSDAPGIEVLLEVDRDYREKARAGLLPKIAPRRFNPDRTPWLAVLHANRGPWNFTGSGSVSYGKTFDCSGQGSQRTYGYDFNNTVSDGIGDSASAKVHVDCYSLAVNKTAGTQYTRSWTWNIAKSYISPALTVDTNNDHTPDALLVVAPAG